MSAPRIYITHARTEKSLHQLLEGLPDSIHQRALRYRREEDAHHFVLGRLLLREGLIELEVDDTIDNIQYEKSGKPFLESVFFNISHSSDRVVCAISDKGRIGIDIEKEQEVELDLFESWFTPVEWKAIKESRFPLRQFYRYWTKKESIIKALGLTLSALNQIELDLQRDVFEANGQLWYVTELTLGADYIGAICSEVQWEVPIPMKYKSFQ